MKLPEGCSFMAMIQEMDSEDTDQNDGRKADIRTVLNRLLIRQGYRASDFNLKKHSSGKPYGMINDEQVGVSISHCRSLLVCALHTRGETGVDVECCDREVPPGLKKRMCHPEEMQALPDTVCCIRLWTMKEAVLKFKGTGLRLAMKSICLKKVKDYLFETTVDNKRIWVVSFTFENHWIAIAFSGEDFVPDVLA